jgi:hypothetical protein
MNSSPPQSLVILAVIGSLILGGCGTFRTYSVVRDKQGEAAKKAWAGVDLKGVVTTERTNLDSLLAAELEAQDRLATGVRNYTLRAMVDGKNLDDALVKPVENRLDKLVGSQKLLVTSLEEREKRAAAELNLIGKYAPDFEQKMLSMPTCSDVADDATPSVIKKWLASASEIDKGLMDEILRQLREDCVAASEDPVYQGLGGDINNAWKQYKNDSTQLEISRKESVKMQDSYLAAVAAYDKAIAASQTTPEAVQATQNAVTNLGKALDALAKAQDAFSVSFLSEERLKSIDKLVVAITETAPGEKLPDEADQATVAFILIPQLLDAARQSLADTKKPLAIPLLMRRNYEQLNLEAAKRDIASREAMVRLSRELVATIYQQAIQLYMASKELHATSANYHKLPVLEAFSKPPPGDRERIYSAAARFLDALNRLDAKRYKLEYMRIGAIHERSLAYTEVNIRQWQSLIGITVDQVADFSASGIKPDTIGSLINTLGILWIGAGVNK